MAVAKSAVSATVAGDTASSAVHTEGASSITVISGDTLLVLLIEADTGTPGTVTAHWDAAGTNQLMTLLGTVVTNSAGGTPITLAAFGLLNPTAGAKLFSWQWSGATGTVGSYRASISFTGTDTTSVANATEGYNTVHTTGTGTAQSVTTAASIPSGDMAVAMIGDIDGINAINGTNIGINNNLTTNAAAAYYSGAGATVTSTVTCGASAGQYAGLIVGIKAPGGGATNPVGNVIQVRQAIERASYW